jgi:hypothetical protein
MRFIKLPLISLIVFAILFTFISFLFPSYVHISRALDIQAEKNKVREAILNTSSWLYGKDSAAKDWTFLLERKTDSSIDGKLVRANHFIAACGWNILSSHIPNSVAVQWHLDFHLAWYPWEKFSSLLLDKNYGPFMENALTRLKNQLESINN